MKGGNVVWTIILWTLLLLSLVETEVSTQVVWETATKIAVKIDSTVAFDVSRKTFTFSYRILNKPESVQRVDSFRIESGVPPLQVSSPERWKHVYMKQRKVISWGAISLKSPISPQSSLSGFSFSTGALPGINTTFTRGFVEVLPHVEHVTTDLPPPPDPFEDSIKVKTVGPDILPDALRSDQLIDRVVTLKEQAFQLRWIDNQGVANSLNKKLSVAKVRIQTGQKAAGINVLHAVIHELQAQQGKHVNDNAFYLLKANAEFLIFKIEKG